MAGAGVRGFWLGARVDSERTALVDVDGAALSAGELETFRKLPPTEEQQRKVVGDNWSRLYDIPLERKRQPIRDSA